jgi:hypothetical protein
MFSRARGVSGVAGGAGVRGVVGVCGVLDELAMVAEDDNSKKLYSERSGRCGGMIGERKRWPCF